MKPLDYPERNRLARQIRGCIEAVSSRVTDEFLNRHPDWQRRYGMAARTKGLQDACYHLEFLTGAVGLGSPAAYAEYCEWCASVLTSRGIQTEFLLENLEQIRENLWPELESLQREVVQTYFDAGSAAVANPSTDSVEAFGDGDLGAVRGLFLQAILSGNRSRALGIVMEALRSGHEIVDLYIGVIARSLHEIGTQWQRNDISVAEEHSATAIAQYVIANLYSHMQPSSNELGNAIISGTDSEMHQIGGNIVADVMEAAGWNVRFLGTYLPHHDILRAIEQHEAEVLGISAATLMALPSVESLVGEVKNCFGEDSVRIIVGGGAIRCAPGLSEDLGLVPCPADLREAVAGLSA